MKSRLIAATTLLLVGGTEMALVETQSATGSNPFAGAWLITETTTTDDAGTNVNKNPEPGVYIFTERHFSDMLIPGGERVPLGSEWTDAKRLKAYDNFVADSGTYEYTESTVTARNIIAKIPDVMPPHTSGPLTYRWRLDDEDLVLTLTGGWAPPNGEVTYRLSRLE